MSKATRIAKSVNLNIGKYNELDRQAKLLGGLRKEIWHRFGSINGVGASFREIRNLWVKTRNFRPLPAKAWKETLRNVLDDIAMYEASVKVNVRRATNDRTSDQKELKRLFSLLKGSDWAKDRYLARKMRKHKKHGKTNVENQIILEGGVYGQFIGKNGNTWLKIPSFTRGAQVCIPLNSNIVLKGALRLILKDGVIFVHYTIEKKKFAPCGDSIIGVDKGYSEAFADSEGNFFGKQFGAILTRATEKRNTRGKARNKLHKITKKKPHKSANIEKYNLGRKKMNRCNDLQKIRLRDIAFESVHRIVDNAAEVRAEDLTKPFASKRKWKRFNRLMSGWAKGSLAEALDSVTKARGSCLRVVNAAYTSQMDSKTGRLEGRRVGDKFHHVNGDVSHADTNAAVNIKCRADDTGIGLFTPYMEVRAILLNRLTADGGVSDSLSHDRPSLTPVTARKRVSTESELPEI